MQPTHARRVKVEAEKYLVGRDGEVVVIAQSDKVEILVTNTLGDRFDASAAAVGKHLFLRGHQSLYCLGE